MVDDDVPDRGHRTNIFNEDFDRMGSYSGFHKKFKIMTTINYAVGWR